MARTGRPVVTITLTEHELSTLQAYTRRASIGQAIALRARIVLLCAEGMPNKDIAERLGTHPNTITKWRNRFAEDRLEGISDAPRSGRPRTVEDEKVEEVLRITLEELPKGASRWSIRDMAKRTGLGRTTISTIWRAFGLKPHRTETFQLSTDPDFVAKVHDVVGLYMDPPENALVLSVDEKSQIQALNRTQPVLPMRPGQLERRTPEYHRNGTTTLFAALDVAAGNVIGKCFPRHRAVEFIKFLRHIDRKTPRHLDLHLVLDNYASHKTPEVNAFLVRNPRFHLHFIPTHSSWLNQVECWFSLLTEKQLKRGSHRSVAELHTAIEEFLAVYNDDPRPFRWTKSSDEILENLSRFCRDTVGVHGSAD